MSGRISVICIIILQAMVAACASAPQTTAIQAPLAGPSIRESSTVAVLPVIKSANASLYNDASSRNFFQDLRAYQVGDLVTVNIVETSSASKNASTQTGRESSIDAGIDNILGWEGKLKYLTSMGNRNVGNAYNNSSLFNGSMTNSFDGSGTTSRNESMTAYITVMVMEVMANGNLYIQGTREVRVNNETQHIILSGTIRPADISPDNTILSSYIGDARIEYTGSGALSDKQRPGWLTRAVDFVWPF
ncbi:MAG: flagellar basal body L-ring protein FlgH [Deltaproteobacteria bacterium]|nr:flagellar basal body L-ring protein FlgH [Deltaproteobacteria bacterium]